MDPDVLFDVKQAYTMKEARTNAGRIATWIEHRTERGSLRGDGGTATVSGVEFAPGVAAGVTGLGVFLALHAVWIVPIWFVAIFGLLVAVLGGASVSWAYLQVEPHLPDGTVRRWLILTGGAALILTPSVVVAWAGEPYFMVVDGVGVTTANVSTTGVRFVVEFLLVTTLTGTLVGWWVTLTRRGTVAVAVAAFVFALGPGHNLPFFHIWTEPAATQTGLLLTFIPIVVASGVFVAVDVLLLHHENDS